MGLGLFNSIIQNLYGYWRTRAGVTVEARLSSVEWHAHSSGKGSSVWTEASYDYQVGDRWFKASRVALFKTTERYYRPLKQALDTGQPIRVFIDPSDQQFAVIDREFALYPFVIAVPFSLSFIGIGLFLGWCLLVNFQGKAVPMKNLPAPAKVSCRPRLHMANAGRRRDG
jgi:hypothetical protein